MLQLLQILANKGSIAQADVEQIVRDSNDTGVPIEQLLEQRGIGEENLLEARGELWGVPVYKVQEGAIPFDVLKIIPEDSARHYNVVPIGVQDGVLYVGCLSRIMWMRLMR
jgi:hypothetical protein